MATDYRIEPQVICRGDQGFQDVCTVSFHYKNIVETGGGMLNTEYTCRNRQMGPEIGIRIGVRIL